MIQRILCWCFGHRVGDIGFYGSYWCNRCGKWWQVVQWQPKSNNRLIATNGNYFATITQQKKDGRYLGVVEVYNGELGKYETYMAVVGDALEETQEYAEGIMEVL